VFFFSSRRRHTRFSRDWSSDVCSSDLPPPGVGTVMNDTSLHGVEVVLVGTILDVCQKKGCWIVVSDGTSQMRVTFRDYSFFLPRSEERRVGKECGGRGSA